MGDSTDIEAARQRGMARHAKWLEACRADGRFCIPRGPVSADQRDAQLDHDHHIRNGEIATGERP